METVTTEPADQEHASWCTARSHFEDVCNSEPVKAPIADHPLAWLTKGPDGETRIVLDVPRTLELLAAEADAFGAFLTNFAKETR